MDSFKDGSDGNNKKWDNIDRWDMFQSRKADIDLPMYKYQLQVEITCKVAGNLR